MAEHNSFDERFDRLETLINAQGTRLEGRFDKVEGRFDKLDARITDETNKLGIRLDAVAQQVKVIAEGHGALATNIAEMKGGIERLQAGQTNLGLRMLAVELRVTDFEQTQKIVLTEIRGLAARHS